MYLIFKKNIFFSVACIFISLFFLNFDIQTHLYFFLTITAILIFGLPHGAYDIFLISNFFKGSKSKIIFIIYLLSFSFTIFFWILLPNLIFILFILYSAFHFGDSDWPEQYFFEKILWGFSIICIPIFFQTEEIKNLFDLFLNIEFNKSFILILKSITPLILCLNFFITKNKIEKIYLLILYSLICHLSFGLLGFTLYFILVHSIRHLSLWQQRLKIKNFNLLSIIAIAIFFIILFFSYFYQIYFSMKISFNEIYLKNTFICLSALTVPHMVLIFAANKIYHKHKLSND